MPKTADGGLTPKQQAFVREYLVDLNATQAAIRAGYSERSAYAIGHDLLRKHEIATAVQKAMNERAKAVEITAERVVMELCRMAFSNMAEYIRTQEDGSAVVDLRQLTPDQAAAIQEITSEVYMEGSGDDAVPVKRTKLKLHARTQALDMLGRHLGMFIDRRELTGAGGGPIEIEAHTIPLGELSPRLKRQILAELAASEDAPPEPPRLVGKAES